MTDENEKREYTHILAAISGVIFCWGGLYDQMSLAEKGRMKMKNGNILTARRAGESLRRSMSLAVAALAVAAVAL